MVLLRAEIESRAGRQLSGEAEGNVLNLRCQYGEVEDAGGGLSLEFRGEEHGLELHIWKLSTFV